MKININGDYDIMKVVVVGEICSIYARDACQIDRICGVELENQIEHLTVLLTISEWSDDLFCRIS